MIQNTRQTILVQKKPFPLSTLKYIKVKCIKTFLCKQFTIRVIEELIGRRKSCKVVLPWRVQYSHSAASASL